MATKDLERFTEGFRNEHRAARDNFLGMARALSERDAARIADLISSRHATGPWRRA